MYVCLCILLGETRGGYRVPWSCSYRWLLAALYVLGFELPFSGRQSMFLTIDPSLHPRIPTFKYTWSEVLSRIGYVLYHQTNLTNLIGLKSSFILHTNLISQSLPSFHSLPPPAPIHSSEKIRHIALGEGSRFSLLYLG